MFTFKALLYVPDGMLNIGVSTFAASYTPISHNEYPYANALFTPCIFTYLHSVASNTMLSSPPLPLLFSYTVQLFPSFET